MDAEQAARERAAFLAELSPAERASAERAYQLARKRAGMQPSND